MSKKDSIPEIGFKNRDQKAFEFQISSNKDALKYHLPTDHDPFRPHRIRYYAILVFLKGEGNHFIDFKTYPYKRGSVIFISKEQVHAFEPNEERDARFMIFTDTFLQKSSLGSDLLQQLSLYNYHLYSPLLQLEENQFEVFVDLVERIHSEYLEADDFATEEIILSSLRIFLCLAERIRKKNLSDQPKSKYHLEFLDFQDVLKKYLFQSRQVKFYADQLMMSTKKLNRITQEIMNLPAKNYIDEVLIIEIKRLLMNTSLSVKEIAYKAGFEETTNFVKYFKKMTQSTPAQFRKKF